MSDVGVSREDFPAFVRPLLGLMVSLPWKGYGSAIFLELGQLAPLESPRQHYNQGESCISVEWDWRVEAEAASLYGSSNSGPTIERGIQSLQGATIQAISVVGQIPELVVQFSNGHCLRSMIMIAGDPEWSIKLPDERWIYVRKGHLFVGEGGVEMTAEEDAAFAIAERTAARWGTPSVEPRQGSCNRCVSFVRLDGEGRLLDYGCCIAEAGPLDGRVVRGSGGCPAFSDAAHP